MIKEQLASLDSVNLALGSGTGLITACPAGDFVVHSQVFWTVWKLVMEYSGPGSGISGR